jgi:imidazolonepropionase-like amidohydrolase
MPENIIPDINVDPPEGSKVITNVKVFNGVDEKLIDNAKVLIVDNMISKIFTGEIEGDPDHTIIDGGGRVLMPGLVDMHTHVAITRGVNAMRDEWDAWAGGAMASEAMRDKYLAKGFTTIRDCGGASLGLSRAVSAGEISGPRLVSAGAVISGTSGHGDWSKVTDQIADLCCGGAGIMSLTEQAYVCDGPWDVAKAVRTNLKKGAAFIKLMANGGVVSDFDHLYSYGLTLEELTMGVRAAADYGTYAATHAYTDETVNRALDAGIKSIEHGFLMKEETVKRIVDEGAIFSWQAYASIVTFAEPEKLPGFTADHIRKAKAINANAKRVPGWLKKYGVTVIGGSDLYFHNTLDLLIDDLLVKEEWYSPVEILRMHTSTAGEVLAMSGPKNPYKDGPLGVIQEGAYADMLLVDGNPLVNLGILKDEDNLRLIMKDGKILKNTLS